MNRSCGAKTGSICAVTRRQTWQNLKQAFTLTRYTMTCCVADARPLNVVIYVASGSGQTLPVNQLAKKWVRVTGQVQFLMAKGPQGREQWRSAVVLTPSERHPLSKLIEVVDPPANPFVE